MSDQAKKPWAFGQMFAAAAVAVLVWSGAGFGWVGKVDFGWTTEGAAVQMAQQAVTDAYVPICVAQARADPDAEAKLVELKENAGYKQTGFVEKQGWATMPGSESPAKKVAGACATALLE